MILRLQFIHSIILKMYVRIGNYYYFIKSSRQYRLFNNVVDDVV